MSLFLILEVSLTVSVLLAAGTVPGPPPPPPGAPAAVPGLCGGSTVWTFCHCRLCQSPLGLSANGTRQALPLSSGLSQSQKRLRDFSVLGASEVEELHALSSPRASV